MFTKALRDFFLLFLQSQLNKKKKTKIKTITKTSSFSPNGRNYSDANITPWFEASLLPSIRESATL